MKNKKAKIYVNGKEVNVEKIRKEDPIKNRARDHVLDEMKVGPVKRVVYKKILNFLDDFIEDRLGPK